MIPQRFLMLSLIFPNRCIGCEAWLDGEPISICADCTAQLNFLTTPAFTPALERRYFDAAYSVLAYEGKVHDWIGQFKFFRQFHVGRVLTLLLAQARLEWDAFDAFVPVPIHFWRHLRRGFNPAALLAHSLAKKFVKPFWPLLRKKRFGRPQTTLSRAQRLENVRGTFALGRNRRRQIKGRRLLLIDDVLTTGSTVNECARVLKKAGTDPVVVLTLARTL